jgi:iron complex outermembrane receptor protein
VNLVVKRPNGQLRNVRVEAREHGSLLGAVDISQRFGADGALGPARERGLRTPGPAHARTQGQRSLLALAADWQLGADTLLQAELESSRQSQPSVAGFSMLGDTCARRRTDRPAPQPE